MILAAIPGWLNVIVAAGVGTIIGYLITKRTGEWK